MRVRRPAHFVGSALVAAALIAGVDCGGKGGMQTVDAGRCPMDLPPSCPSPAPSYAGQVNTIIQTYCVPCHSPTGVAAPLSFATYSDIHDNAGRSADMLNQLHQCFMPPSYAPAQPPEADRVALLGWLVCGAPNN
jgi:hypothetical protein